MQTFCKLGFKSTRGTPSPGHRDRDYRCVCWELSIGMVPDIQHSPDNPTWVQSRHGQPTRSKPSSSDSENDSTSTISLSPLRYDAMPWPSAELPACCSVPPPPIWARSIPARRRLSLRPGPSNTTRRYPKQWLFGGQNATRIQVQVVINE